MGNANTWVPADRFSMIIINHNWQCSTIGTPIAQASLIHHPPMEGQHMVRRLAITGCLTWFLVSMLAEAHTWSRRHRQIGWASWYGSYHHGRKTASGERFSMHALTAAHRSLPFGTTVRVTNLDTGQQVKVRINDRGPFVDQQRRIIDLSRAAAERIGLQQRGVGHVRLDVLEKPATKQTRPARPVARATQVRSPRLTRVESAANALQPALTERAKGKRLADEPAARPRVPSHTGAVAPSSVSWLDCRVAEAECLAGD